jgi:tetratricopeptide (TPR) repeat protein/predicted aspartyl protease
MGCGPAPYKNINKVSGKPTATVMLRGLCLAALLAFAGYAGRATAATCTLGRVAELPVTMIGLRPTVHAKINGQDALFLADSGAFYSTLTHAAALQYKLSLGYSPVTLSGVGGQADTWLTVVRQFTIFNLEIPNVDFLVTSNDFGAGTVGLLGQNVWRLADPEYDLANGVIRLVRPKDCKNTPLAYWSAASGKPYNVIDIELATREFPHTVGEVWVNGNKMRAIFDTGAAISIMTADAAKRAGVTPSTPGVVEAGQSHGIGSRVSSSWIGPFASFKIGDEEVRNTKLRFAALHLTNAEMLLGADFFLSHHVYVANSQRKLYFTYNGGPVFNLTAAPPEIPSPSMAEDSPPEASTAANAASPDASAAGTPMAGAMPAPGEPTDAAGYARRGSAYAARHDNEHAIADLTRACTLDPSEASYFYARGMAYWSSHQPILALPDIEHALTLKPQYVAALLARVELRAGRNDPRAELLADLDNASRIAPREDPLRLQMGLLYAHLGQPRTAIEQYTEWIDTRKFEDNVQMADASNLRCWTRALNNLELPQALDDCNRAVRLRGTTASYYDSRGLVYLRQGNYAKAIADYDQSLKLHPNAAWSLYGRGLAKLRSGHAAGGQADLAAAAAANPNISTEAGAHGLGP